jgi:hypothetical protein
LRAKVAQQYRKKAMEDNVRELGEIRERLG